MNKMTVVLGIAAVATLAGCKDPDYKYATRASETEAKIAEPVVAPAPAPAPEVAPAPTPAPAPAPVPAEPIAPAVEKPAPTTTTYIVQPNDCLSKIAQKYKLRIDDIRALNASIKKDRIWVGQKIKLPGAIDVGVQKAPPVVRKASAKKAPAKVVDKPFTGATKEYVVKSGDTLGAIAYSNGMTIRQLKALNGLTKNNLAIGQKLKVSAEGKKAAAKSAKPAASAPKAPVAEPTPAPAPVVEPTPAPVDATPASTVDATPAPTADAAADVAPADAAADAAPADAAPAPAPAPATATYVVQEGDDITGVSIRWGVTASVIRELNNLPEDAQLKPGQVLKLPADAQQ